MPAEPPHDLAESARPIRVGLERAVAHAGRLARDQADALRERLAEWERGRARELRQADQPSGEGT